MSVEMMLFLGLCVMMAGILLGTRMGGGKD